MGEMSSDSNDNSGSPAESPQPASGPMDEDVARWYVEHTGGQFQAFPRDGVWYLYLPVLDMPQAGGPGAAS